jgi:glutathione synthase/RimK-type ligase-like ATP-grasp enzyme
MTVLLCGIPSETPLALVAAALEEMGVPHVTFNQRRWQSAEIRFGVDAGGVGGTLRLDGVSVALDDVVGVYTRLMDDGRLPDVVGLPAGSPKRAACAALHDALFEWTEIAPTRVVSRCAAMASNGSKPYQAQRIVEAGFDVPDTLVTNDPALVDEFRARHGRIVYKSMSGVRSIVRVFGDTDRARLPLVRWCPVQFQEFVEGYNVRVHTVGTTTVFATRIVSETPDYRYACLEDDDAELTAFDLPAAVASQCLELAAALDLPFAGIDLKFAPSGRVVCFEVNPCPAFSYYEQHTGQPIAGAVARYLSRGDTA